MDDGIEQPVFAGRPSGVFGGAATPRRSYAQFDTSRIALENAMRFGRSIVLWLPVVLLAVPLQVSGQDTRAVVPLKHAHAHNDYLHERPLFDALERGFCSVEADVFLVNGELLVGHDRHELREGRTLQKLYLDPLRQRVNQGGGRVYPNGPTMTLLVDIKAEGERVYAVLRNVLASYDDILCGIKEGRHQHRAVQVVISGDRPKKTIAADKSRHAGMDGRLADLDSKEPAHLMPLISDRWTSHFRWRGVGEFPPAEREKLRSIVKRAHTAGRRVRFWATPEDPNVWRELLAAGVDHINTDQLDRLREFLLQR
jgi:hypothetical protein